MSFLKRLSRSRHDNYIDDEYDRSPESARGYDTHNPPTSFKGPGQFLDSPVIPGQFDNKDLDIYQHGSQDSPYAAARTSQPSNSMRGSRDRERDLPTRDSYVDVHPPQMTSNAKAAVSAPTADPAPAAITATTTTAAPPAAGLQHSSRAQPGPPMDLLSQAFNQAVQPYQEQIAQLEQQLQDMNMQIDELERQKQDVYDWIDKRGLRTDVPPDIAKAMDTHPEAANKLSAQLDRKMTIVNFDMHRLQDDLNDNVSSAHFASAMARFIPDIQRLTFLPTGPRYSYELIIKLIGNLNAHGGLETSATATEEEVEDDRVARAAFYDRMDAELVEVVRRRIAEGEDWPISREIKRLEKNAAYLKNLGVDNYFPRTLQVMKQETDGRAAEPPRYINS